MKKNLKDKKTDAALFLDNFDFFELVLRHLAFSEKVMTYALKVKMQGSDMLTGDPSTRLYAVFAEILLRVGKAPVEDKLFLSLLKTKMEDAPILQQQKDILAELYQEVFTDRRLHEEFIIEHLPAFIKTRRQQYAISLHKENPDLVKASLDQIAFDVKKMQSTSSEQQWGFPMLKLAEKTHYTGIPTGFKTLDSQMHGLAKGHYGLIIGPSGGGKTAFAMNMCKNAAMLGFKATYIGLENTYPELADRIYSNVLHIPYTDLLYSKADMLKEEMFKAVDKDTKELLSSRLMIRSYRDEAPVTSDFILQELELVGKETGFYPDVVFIDQLDYIEPTISSPESQLWSEQGKVSFECDNLSHVKLGGKHSFALWVLHQQKGDLKRVFKRSDIEGFKGIIKPTDITIGIGRDAAATKDKHSAANMSSECSIFSLKTRHCAPFLVDMIANMQYMRFEEMSPHLVTNSETENPMSLLAPPIELLT